MLATLSLFAICKAMLTATIKCSDFSDVKLSVFTWIKSSFVFCFLFLTL